IAARRKGRRVLMVERGRVGGTCVNTGCVPSKALLAAAHARHIALDQRFPGIATTAGPVDPAALLAGKQALVEGLRADKYVELAASYGWEILGGQARFVADPADGGGPALQVDLPGGGTRRIHAAHYLVATGSAPWAPPVDGLEAVGYLTSTSAMELAELPRSLLVVGGNAVGLEQAQLFARLGTQVTVVELLGRLAPLEEPEAGAAIAAAFADEGITVHTGAQLTGVARDPRGDPQQVVATVYRRDGHREQLRAERLLVATGRRPVTDGLGLEAVGVKLGDRGQVLVDEQLRTHHPRIWAAGDVTGAPQFVYLAAAHGSLVADNALDGAGRTLDYRHLPRVTFTSPPLAAVGLTDAQAARQGIACTCRVLPLAHVPRALVDRDTRGLVKLVAERASGRVLGATMVAHGAGDAILAAVYAVKLGLTTGELADTWAPYLTMGEGLRLAAQAFTRDVAKLSCCAA
ncbi:MAG TPA: mercury(II) reductase, partial [Actinomycetes bacterium]|nr:mercury(II) reductase [Actinomycetes bacterium]